VTLENLGHIREDLHATPHRGFTGRPDPAQKLGGRMLHEQHGCSRDFCRCVCLAGDHDLKGVGPVHLEELGPPGSGRALGVEHQQGLGPGCGNQRGRKRHQGDEKTRFSHGDFP
jgi:hypothetical protein